jgi:hypothetical protein
MAKPQAWAKENGSPQSASESIEGIEPHSHAYDPESECVICRRRRPFEVPPKLVNACISRDLVVFAGAGVSTESPSVLPWTLFQDVARSVELDPATTSFPAAMSAFEDLNGRPALLQLAKDRFDHIDSFPGLRRAASAFHRELSTLFYVSSIVTTNWDTYFETECGATPIVTPKDYAFWGLPGRKVFKLHGSMNNIGSIVATEADYEACYESLREGAIGSSLKHLLATKTIAFVGYSFRDEDFARIYSLIQDQLGEMLPRPFIVTLDDDFDASAFPGATIVTTDAAFFVQELKRAVREERDCLLPDEQFNQLGPLLEEVRDRHLEMTNALALKTYPLVLYAACYQDGLMDALERALAMRSTGTYSHTCDTTAMVRKYEELRKRALRKRDYWDVAYVEGYQNGMLFLLIDDDARDAIPLYFAFGADNEPMPDLDAYRKVIERGEKLHKTAYKRARKVADSFRSDDVVVHHPPLLLGLQSDD